MAENNEFSVDVSQLKGWRSGIKIAAYLVYLAGALFATIVFSQHLSSKFPTEPVFRLMAYVGAWANFFSLAVMPLAKVYWVNGTAMVIASWAFWLVEFGVVVFNTLAAFGSPWGTWWTPLSPGSPVLVVAVWGILWYLNPEATVLQDQVDFYVGAQKDFQGKMRRALKSQKVQQIMEQGAALAAQQYAEKSLNVAIDPTHVGKVLPDAAKDLPMPGINFVPNAKDLPIPSVNPTPPALP